MFSSLFRHRRGILGTVIFHLSLVAIFLFFGFAAKEIPGEEGLLINFGTDLGGQGIVEPAASSAQPEQTASQPSVQPVARTESSQADEPVMTQKFEESAVVESGKQQVKNEKTPQQIEAERKRQEEIEKQRLAESERRRQEELERQRIAEEQRRIQEIYNRTSNAFQGRNPNPNTSTSEGETGATGNQGKPEGSIDSRIHGEGQGLGNDGISFDLAGRTAQLLPKPEYNSQKEGKVVVEVTVDRNGNVTNAVPGVKGSSTLDEYLLSMAKKAALAAKFDRKPDATEQKGTITYIFILE